MTAPTLVYCNAPKQAWQALLAIGTPRVMLLDAAHTPNQDTHDFVSDIRANEAAGTGYVADGPALVAVTVTLDAASNTITITCDNIDGISVPCRWGAFYVDTGVDATSPVMSYADFSEGIGGNVTLTETLSLDTDGFLVDVVA